MLSLRMSQSDMADLDDNFTKMSSIKTQADCHQTDNGFNQPFDQQTGPIDPQNCFQIPSLEKEIEENKDRKPLDIYLEHCNNFAKNNLKREKIEVKPFVISSDHVRTDSSSSGLPPVMKHEICRELAELHDDEIADHFEIKKQRLFKNIYYYKGDMFLIVKSWEHVKYNEPNCFSKRSQNK